MNQRITNFARIVLSIAACVIVVAFAHAWTAPTTAPTGGDVAAPVNTGTVDQTKQANLGLTGGLFAAKDPMEECLDVPLNLVCGMQPFIRW